MTGGYLDFYNLTDIFIDNLETSLEHFYFYSLEKVYQWLNIKGFLNDEIIDILEDKYKYAVETYIEEYLSDNIQEIISSTIENTKISLDESSTIDDCIDYYLDFVDQDIYQYIDETLDQIHDKAIFNLICKNKSLLSVVTLIVLILFLMCSNSYVFMILSYMKAPFVLIIVQ